MKAISFLLSLVLIFSMIMCPIASAAEEKPGALNNRDSLAEMDGATEPQFLNADPEGTAYDGYLFCEENGQPKYWLDFSRALASSPVLHCYFRSGEPAFHETCYILDLSSADHGNDNTLVFNNIHAENGQELSEWFDSFSLEFHPDGVLMAVERNESSLSGGPEDNLLTGSYSMEPVEIQVSYEYRDKNGTLKYWLVRNAESIELHGNFYSGDPETFEEVYLLDGAAADLSEDSVVSFGRILKDGSDVSKWFKTITLSRAGNSYLLSVKRDESTLAGGAGDNLLTGTYAFEAAVRFIPLETGPFTEEALAVLAQQYYFLQTGYFPPEADVTLNEDGSFTIQLYEITEQAGTEHTAISAWYTVDPFGVGISELSGEEVYLAS